MKKDILITFLMFLYWPYAGKGQALF